MLINLFFYKLFPRQLLNNPFQLKHDQQRRNLSDQQLRQPCNLINIDEANPLPPVVEPMLAELVQIRRALAANRGNIAKTARQLGLSRQALYRRLEKYDIR